MSSLATETPFTKVPDIYSRNKPADDGLGINYLSLLPVYAFTTKDRFSTTPTILVDGLKFDHRGQDLIGLTEQENKNKISSAFKRAQETQSDYNIVYPLISENGAKEWVQEYGRAVQGDSNNDMFVTLFITRPSLPLEISSNSLIDDSAYNIISRQHFAFQESCGGVAILADDHFIYLNESHCQMYGYTAGECIGKSWRMLYSEEEIRRIESEIFPVLIKDRHWSGEVTGRKKTGESANIVISLSLAKNGDLVCSCIDITNQKAIEQKVASQRQALADAHETLSTLMEERSLILNSSSELILVFDHSGYLTFYNDAAKNEFTQITGFKTYLSDIPELKNSFDVQALFSGSTKERQPVDLKFRIRGKSIRTLEGRGIRFNDISGDSRIHFFLRDVTSFIDTQDALEYSRNEFREICHELTVSARLRQQLIANISHELRTPLANILGIVDVLVSGVLGETIPYTSKKLSQIRSSAAHLLLIINDVIDYSRLSAGGTDLQPMSCSVRDLVQESLLMTQSERVKKNQSIEIDISPSDFRAYFDPLRIRQVLINLLSNACKFSPENTKITLRAYEALRKNSAVIEIQDEGCGISSNDIPKLFTAFSQVDADLNRRAEGAGLGLAIVKRIVHAHRGTISVASELSKGTCFTINIPIDEKCGGNTDNEVNDIYSQLVRRDLPDIAVSREIVLLSGPGTPFTQVAKQLKLAGYWIKDFSLARSAIDYSLEHRVHMMIVDSEIQLSELNQVSSVLINSDDTRAQMIKLCLAGTKQSLAEKRAYASGFHSSIPLPISFVDILTRVESLLN
jgi:PAS domain S-box-containing protein